MKLYSIFFSLIFSGLVSSTIAAGPMLKVKVQTMVGEFELGNVDVRLYDGNELIKELTADKDGKVTLELEYGKYYILEMKGEETLANRIIIDTRFPVETKEPKSCEMSHELYLKSAFIPRYDHDFPVAIVAYDDAQTEFIEVKKFTEQRKKEIDQGLLPYTRN